MRWISVCRTRSKPPTGKNTRRKTNGARSPTICRTRGNLADKSPASAVQSRPGKHRRKGKTGHCKVSTSLRTNRELLFRADKEGNKKPSVPKSAGGVLE